ncbi:nucleotidyltransferase family protein [Streptomyces sp. NBC_01511]|uniref:nucleotidyltransferase family protein n=1 Tax=Streptomyces sp. NBC_01511 TaxID=2903889 RepID=UPI003864E9D9
MTMTAGPIPSAVAAVVSRLTGSPLDAGDGESLDAPLLDLGMDSVRVVQLVSELEKVFGVAVGPRELVLRNFATLRSVSELVERSPSVNPANPASPTTPAGRGAAPSGGQERVPGRSGGAEGRPAGAEDGVEPAHAGFPVEGRLLMLTARTRMTPGQVALAAELINDPAHGLDRGGFIELAARHRVINLVARSLDRERLTPKDPVMHAQLRGSYLYNTQRNRALQAELKLLLQEFESYGINAVVRKGTYLSNSFYADPALRYMVDLDIYVPAPEIDRYGVLMTDLGYRQGSKSANGRIIERMSRDEEIFSRLHESALPPFWRLTSDPYVDIFGIDASHDVMPPTSGKSLPAGDILERARRGTVGGESAWIPSPEDMLLDLAVHLYREATWICSIEAGKDICLIRFVDIVEWYGAMRDRIDQERLVELARKYDLVPELFYGLHHTDILYPGVIDPALLDRLRPDDLTYLDEYGLLDRRPTPWKTPFIDRVFDSTHGRGISLGTPA